MKLILTAELDNLGQPGDIVEVADGYGRNFLIPQGHAIRWSRGGEKQISTITRAREVRHVRDVGHAQEIAQQLAGLTVTLHARAGSGGKLFGSITPSDVVEAVKGSGGPVLDRRRVSLAAPIKAVGRHTVSVDLHPEVTASFPVEVVSD